MISLLVPFRDDDGTRTAGWNWLRRYWAHALPEAEIVEASSPTHPFSKAAAVNRASRRATGDVFVLIDADCYMDANVLRRCAADIRMAAGPLWFVPYRALVRMTKQASDDVLASDPTEPPDVRDATFSRRYRQPCGIVNVCSREAFRTVRGMDSRFHGWGGEDEAFIRSLDVLYAPHTRTENDVYHLFHREAPRRTQSNRGLLWRYMKADAAMLRRLRR